jgi:tRNA threonylcarbamoyladenosine biosynthesis protein TsaE
MMLPAPLSTHLDDEAATLALGARVATGVEPGLVTYLHGELGSGKTTLTRGLLRALGYEGKVKSPTYTLVEPYALSRLDFYHFDLYRLRDSEEWALTGFRDYFNDTAVVVVEWPEKAADQLPLADLEIDLTPAVNRDGATLGRDATIKANTERGIRCLTRIETSR